MVLRNKFRESSRPIIAAGFTLMLVVFLALIVTWLYQNNVQHNNFAKVAQLRKATELVGIMHRVALTRSILLFRMSMLADPFEREDLHMEFKEIAGDFIAAREQLQALRLSPSQLAIWEETRKNISENGALQEQAVSLIFDNQIDTAKAFILEEVIPRQNLVISQLSKMLLRQNMELETEIDAQDHLQKITYMVIAILGTLGVIIGIAIGRFVISTTIRIQADRLKAEEARVANKMKSEFLANMSHEIRTPLTSIIGYSEAALAPEQSREERLDGIRRIIRNSKHLLHVINSILDLSKVEAGKLEVECIPTSLREIVKNVCSAVEGIARAKNLKWDIHFKFPLPREIHTDPIRLTQVLINLCSNAFKFTEEGYVYLNISFDRHSSQLCLEVEDSGIGMSEDQLAHIFEAFSQADVTTTRRFGGTGLGLTLSKKLVELMDGDLQVESRTGIGSRFTVWIPTGDMSKTTFVHETGDFANDTQPENKMEIAHRLNGRILLAEDGLDNQHLISRLLQQAGADVDIANNGLEAIKFAEQHNYDLILMDMQMPVMDGVAATRALRERGYSAPVVALTANAFSEDRDRFMQVGCADFISKPLDLKQLSEVLTRYLKPAILAHEYETPLHSTLLRELPDFADIVDLFLNRLSGQISEIRAACDTRAWNDLKTHLHSLKGTAGGVGYPEITDMAGKIEFQIIKEDYQTVRHLLAELEQLVARALAGRQTVLAPADMRTQ